MFLDDELLKMCKKADLTDIQKLYNDVFTTCESYYKGLINPKSTDRQMKTAVDKSFNLYDSFARSLKKELPILSELFTEGKFKKMFLSHKELKKVYESL